MQEQVLRFKRLVQQQMGGRRGRGVRYPEAVRAEAVACARRALAGGQSVASVAASLGLGALTLSRWLEQGDGVGLREVEIVAAEPAAEPARAGVVLVTPSGYRVEGLGLAQVAELLRALG